MKTYKNNDTGELFTIDELKTLWKQFKHEMDYDTFDDFVSTLEEQDQGKRTWKH